MVESEWHWTTAANFRQVVARDIKANRRDPKIQLTLVFFRLCQLTMGDRWRPRRISLPLVLLYRIWSELVVGLELRPKTSVGPGLTIFHGFGMVINDHCNIGSDVTLRNGVTIGSRRDGGPVPRLGNGVVVGCGAIILGDIELDDYSRVGAGSVLLISVPRNSTVFGNPAVVSFKSDPSGIPDEASASGRVEE